MLYHLAEEGNRNSSQSFIFWMDISRYNLVAIELTRIWFCHICEYQVIGGSHKVVIWCCPDHEASKELKKEKCIYILKDHRERKANSNGVLWRPMSLRSLDTWSPASFTFASANFSCSSDRVMPVYLHPVCLTTSIANLPQPHPISRTSCSSSILAYIYQKGKQWNK